MNGLRRGQDGTSAHIVQGILNEEGAYSKDENDADKPHNSFEQGCTVHDVSQTVDGRLAEVVLHKSEGLEHSR